MDLIGIILDFFAFICYNIIKNKGMLYAVIR